MFGSMKEYHPISAKDQSTLHQFGQKMLPGIFIGYVLFAGRLGKGDVLVPDSEELEKLDAPVIHARRVRKSISMWDQLVRSEELSVDLRGSLDWSQPTDEITGDGEARGGFW